MSAALTFGSVGDIISVCLLVNDLVTTLGDSRGSVSEYQDMIRDLRYVQELLYTLNGLAAACDLKNHEYLILGVTARQKAKDLKELVEPFYEKVKKYDERLTKPGSRNALADVYWKVDWRLRHKEAVARFRSELQGRRMAISAILMTAHFTSSMMRDNMLRKLIEDGQNKNELMSQEYLSRLKALKKDTEETAQIASTASVLNWLGLSYLQGFRTDLMGKMEMLCKICFDTLEMVSLVNTQIPRFHNQWSQQPAILDDALGNIHPIYLDLVDSWKIFDDIMARKFEDLPGEAKVARRQYVLEDEQTNQQLDRTRNWKACFRPGRRVLMSMIFEELFISEQACPSCGAHSSGPTDSLVTCNECGLQYRRITEVEHIKPNIEDLVMDSAATGSSERRLKPELTLQSLGPSAPLKETEDDVESLTDDDVCDFRRVRLVSQAEEIAPDELSEAEEISPDELSEAEEISPDELSEMEEISPDEPRYCICNDVSFGTMISCDNQCEKEWFHLECVGIKEIPPRRQKWYCPECRVALNVDTLGNRVVEASDAASYIALNRPAS
jgi:hypothetical protein